MTSPPPEERDRETAKKIRREFDAHDGNWDKDADEWGDYVLLERSIALALSHARAEARQQLIIEVGKIISPWRTPVNDDDEAASDIATAAAFIDDKLRALASRERKGGVK